MDTYSGPTTMLEQRLMLTVFSLSDCVQKMDEALILTMRRPQGSLAVERAITLAVIEACAAKEQAAAQLKTVQAEAAHLMR